MAEKAAQLKAFKDAASVCGDTDLSPTLTTAAP
jgi:hypothetical protein